MKNIKKSLISIGIALVVFGAMYSIDMYHMKRNEPVMFSTWGHSYVPPVNAVEVEEPVNNVQEDDEIYTFVGTILEETKSYIMVEPNYDEAERNSSDRIVVHYPTEHSDYLYGIGRRVIIKYNGLIKETYPAQITANEILVDGYKEFELSVIESENKEKKKILNNTELYTYNLDYNLYYYGLENVKVNINGQDMELEDALRSGKLTIEGLIAKANKDGVTEKIRVEAYSDGGTTEYHYDKFSIIKMHNLSGDRDVYIGVKGMTLHDID